MGLSSYAKVAAGMLRRPPMAVLMFACIPDACGAANSADLAKNCAVLVIKGGHRQPCRVGLAMGRWSYARIAVAKFAKEIRLL